MHLFHKPVDRPTTPLISIGRVHVKLRPCDASMGRTPPPPPPSTSLTQITRLFAICHQAVVILAGRLKNTNITSEIKKEKLVEVNNTQRRLEPLTPGHTNYSLICENVDDQIIPDFRQNYLKYDNRKAHDSNHMLAFQEEKSS